MELFKRDSKGKIRALYIKNSGSTLIQISGLIWGKYITHEKEIAEKNVWKANHKTAEEACISVKESLIKKKLREWYYKTIEEARDEMMIKPMLAKDYKDYKDKITFSDSYIQPKLDGMRCFTELDWQWGVIMRSRGQKVISGTRILTHIEEQLSNYRGMPIIIDWELYAHKLDFQENMKIAKKFTEGETDVFLKYHIYDTIDEQPFHVRVNRVWFHSEHVVAVTTARVNNEEDIDKFHTKFIAEWYEGSIIRYGGKPYEMKRTNCVLKKKDFIDITAKIIDVEPQQAKPEHWTFVLQGTEWESMWKIFKAGLKGSHEERVEILANKDKYIWQTAEVRFFEYSQDGIPRFPVVHGYRLDK